MGLPPHRDGHRSGDRGGHRPARPATVAVAGRQREAGAGQLVILTGSDDGHGEQRQELINQWNSLDGVPEAILIDAGSLAEQQRATMLQHVQTEHSEVDVFNLDVTMTAGFAEAGYIRPLDRDRLDTFRFLKAPCRPANTRENCGACRSTPTQACCSTALICRSISNHRPDGRPC